MKNILMIASGKIKILLLMLLIMSKLGNLLTTNVSGMKNLSLKVELLELNVIPKLLFLIKL